jgi:anti-sigma B factor antagonist
MKIEIRQLEAKKAGVVRIEGEVGFTETVEVREGIAEALRSGASRVFVDLSGVSFIASDGLNALVQAFQEAQAVGKPFALVQPQPHVMGILQKTQLTKLFHVHASMEEALAAGA